MSSLNTKKSYICVTIGQLIPYHRLLHHHKTTILSQHTFIFNTLYFPSLFLLTRFNVMKKQAFSLLVLAALVLTLASSCASRKYGCPTNFSIGTVLTTIAR